MSKARRAAEADPAPTAAAEAPASPLEDIAEASRAVQPAAAPVADGALLIARALSDDPEGVLVDLAGRHVRASVDRGVHEAVIRTACKNREMVLVTRDEAGKVWIVGALRTQPTPGVDAMDEIQLEAKRVTIVGGEEVQLRSGVAVVAVRAIGEVETYADRIMSRAEEVQKIVARMLRLN
jgi:hypothetical protein